MWRLVGTHDQVAAPQASRGGGAIQISNAPLGGTTLLCQALVVWKLTPWVAPGYQLLSNHSSDTSHCSGEHISNPGGYGEPAHGSYIPNPKTHHTKRDRTKPNIQKQPFSLTPLPSCTSTHSSGEHLNPRLGFTTTRDSSITQRYSSTHSSGEHLNPRLGFTTTPDSSITQRYSAHTTGLTNHPGCLFDRLQLPEERMAHLPAPQAHFVHISTPKITSSVRQSASASSRSDSPCPCQRTAECSMQSTGRIRSPPHHNPASQYQAPKAGR